MSNMVEQFPIAQVSEKPTIFERIIRWLVTKDMTAAERAYILEEARRLKLKNDLCEKRQRERDERLNREKTVAVWRVPVLHDHNGKTTPVTVIVPIVRSQKNRRAFVSQVVGEDHRVINIDIAMISRFVKGLEGYTNYVQPWVEGQLPDKALKHLGDVVLVEDNKK